MPGLVLGVDGGNTKTVALVARRDGTIVGAGRAGCSDLYGAGSIEAAITEVVAAVQAALPAGATSDQLEAAVFSLAGADWDEDKAELSERLAARFPAAGVRVINDAIGALRAGTKDGIGVAVVVGTGGCVGAAAPGGREWHSSWWALHTGAWAIGRDALEAVYAAELGIAEPTALTAAALSTFGEPTVEAVLHAFTRRGGRPSWDAAQLAPGVLQAAVEEDAVASRLVTAHGAKLGAIARVAAEKVGLAPPFPLALLGGVLRGTGSELLVAEIVARVPGGEPVRPTREPVAGALLAALDSTGVRYDPERVEATLPGPELYATRDVSASSARLTS